MSLSTNEVLEKCLVFNNFWYSTRVCFLEFPRFSWVMYKLPTVKIPIDDVKNARHKGLHEIKKYVKFQTKCLNVK